MFTGIIEEIGRVEKLIRRGAHWEIQIAAKKVLEETKPDDSIAVNGACLTVTALNSHGFTVEAVPETVQRSTIRYWQSGELVNLERALPANGRLGGHFVQGHIDGLAHLESIRDMGSNRELSFRCDAAWLELIVEKGSVALDGISLTVARRDNRSFTVAVIPHTLRNTTLHRWRVGETVNLETDILGKYIQQLINPKKESLTRESLMKWGYQFE